MTSQQDMFHPTIQATARRLYYDEETAKLRKGVGGKGSARRFAQVRKQTGRHMGSVCNLPEQLIAKLPKEFDRWKTPSSRSTADRTADNRAAATPDGGAMTPTENPYYMAQTAMAQLKAAVHIS